MITPQQYERLPSVLRDIVDTDRELQALARQDLIPLTSGVRAFVRDRFAARAEKRRYAAKLWGHVARNDGTKPHA